MVKSIKIVLLIIEIVLTVLLFIFIGIYSTRFTTIDTIKKITDYQDGYNLYTMTVEYDYDIQKIINYGLNDTQSYVDAVVKEVFLFLPVKIKLPEYGCSVYRALNEEQKVIMGRNYDFKLDTSCLLVRCNPKNGYKSIACAALNNVGADNATKNLKTKMACLTAPFCCIDGINEKGVSIAVLTLDSEPTVQNNGQPKISTSLAIRLVLDKAATTQEAVDILKGYDMVASNGRDYHFFISDAAGDSRVVEYDCEDESRGFIVTPIQAVTNFYGRYIDKVESFQKNGIYGHGKERYDYMMEVIQQSNGVLNNENSWEALKRAATEPNPENVTSNTQWSIIFNNTDCSAEITLRRHWGDSYSFAIEK